LPSPSIKCVVMHPATRSLETDRSWFNKTAEAAIPANLTELVLIANSRKPNAYFNYYIDHRFVEVCR
jgi:hypothetical protein